MVRPDAKHELLRAVFMPWSDSPVSPLSSCDRKSLLPQFPPACPRLLSRRVPCQRASLRCRGRSATPRTR
jgi:hypothetical protein